MAENRHIQNSKTTRRNIRILDKVTTTNATQTTAYSIPLGEGRATYVRVSATAIQSNFSAAQGLVCEGVFRRASGGNVTRASANNGSGNLILRSVGDFGGTVPNVDALPNTGTQSIDIKVTGKAATTINWYIEILSLQNLD